MQKEKNEEDNNRSFEILYEHIATVEKVNEEYENPDDLIILLYDRSIRHFSLIITNTQNSGESAKIKLGNANNISIKELTKENIITKYIFKFQIYTEINYIFIIYTKNYI